VAAFVSFFFFGLTEAVRSGFAATAAAAVVAVVGFAVFAGGGEGERLIASSAAVPDDRARFSDDFVAISTSPSLCGRAVTDVLTSPALASLFAAAVSAAGRESAAVGFNNESMRLPVGREPLGPPSPAVLPPPLRCVRTRAHATAASRSRPRCNLKVRDRQSQADSSQPKASRIERRRLKLHQPAAAGKPLARDAHTHAYACWRSRSDTNSASIARAAICKT
jgi:hypothetical protein